MAPGDARGPELGQLRRSAEPAVVLSSLARLCVPAFSDRCMVELSEGRQPVFRAWYPPQEDPPGHESADRQQECGGAGLTVISTTFDVPASFGFPAFAGRLVHGWAARSAGATDVVIARLLIDTAVEVVRSERLANAAADADARSAQVAIESMTSRAIGEAIGILMVTRQLPEPAAVQVLRSMGRQAGRTLHEVALEVVLSQGWHPGLARGTASRQSGVRVSGRNLHSVS